jgi:bifunctional non-homologous end joining protein LigD
VSRKVVKIAGKSLSLSNLEKDLYPSYGFTKAHILEYYRRMARFILPHLQDRALTLKRYPEGVDQEFFFEKRCPAYRPAWVKTANVPRDDEEPMAVCLVNDLETLMWVENLASVELHVPLARAASPETPDSLVFDLDPGEPADICACARVALILRDLLSPLGLASYVKTSGKKGLHVYVPLNHPETTFEDTKRFSKAVAEIMQRNYPELVTAKMAKEYRQGRVFINWSQNDAAKTMICVYSLRAREKPFVSFPLAWREMEDLTGQDDPQKLQVIYSEAVNRAEKHGDLFAEVLTKIQQLPLLSTATQGLKEYEAKRKFAQTPEPAPAPGPEGHRLIFVVHKHAARRLHYDLRLELEGVLKSWAVPKGPSLNPAEKRLAVRVEDHPFAYKDFEGVIPEGNYGAGSVIIWDRGFYHHPAPQERKDSEKLLLEGLEQGNFKFVLAGEKLQGEFALVKTAQDDKSWLLMKKKDSHATTEDILAKSRSVVSDKTLEEIAAAIPAGPFSQKPLNQIYRREALEAEDLGDAPVKPMPHSIQPMLATLVKEPFDHPEWLFEVKWDGYRAIAEIQDGQVSLYSRKQISLAKKFGPITASLQKLGFDAILDGEIVVVDDQGRANFQMLQNYQKSAGGHLVYYVFDLLFFHGHALTNLPLIRRKTLLKKILPTDQHLKFSDHTWKEGRLFYQVVREKGVEGILAKHSQSLYRMGKRSRQWLKMKTQLVQEGVIAGFTEPRGGRKYFGSLVLGVYEGDELIYIGHSGGGFGAANLQEIYERLLPLVQKACPFKTEPVTNAPVTWAKPELVCEVVFAGWTEEGLMRQPVFSRLREDKAAHEVRREKPEEI